MFSPFTQHVICTFRHAPRPDADKLIGPIAPNKAIKDPEKQTAWQEEKKKKLMAEMDLHPLGGCVQEALITIWGSKTLHLDDLDTKFNAHVDLFLKSLDKPVDSNSLFIGWSDISASIRQLGLQAVQAGLKAPFWMFRRYSTQFGDSPQILNFSSFFDSDNFLAVLEHFDVEPRTFPEPIPLEDQHRAELELFKKIMGKF